MNTIALAQDTFIQESASRLEESHRRFGELISGHSQYLYRYAYWLARDRYIAEDLVQEALLRAWRSLDKLHNPAAIKGWLVTIVKRENARRFERYQPQECEIPLETLSDQKVDDADATEKFVLRQAIRRLSEEYSVPLILQVIGGYSQKEIAGYLDINPTTVATRLFRARRKLRDMLGESCN